MATSVNSPPQDLLPMELPLTRFAEGSRARTSQTLASRLALRVSEAVSGPNTPASLANYDPASCSWRTSQHCLIEGWTVFSETWPRSGMMRSGIAYQLQPLAPLTEGTDSGWSLGMTQKPSHSVPTPTASDHIERRCTSTEMLNPDTNKSMSLDRYVKFWPTPQAHDSHKGNAARVGRYGTKHGGRNLNDEVLMWPTPSARDWKDNPGAWMWNATNPDGTHRNRTDQLPRKVYAVEGTAQNGGQLNPTWVEWLMGFPLGHTDLEPSETP
jgi:hypothetical protein